MSVRRGCGLGLALAGLLSACGGASTGHGAAIVSCVPVCGADQVCMQGSCYDTSCVGMTCAPNEVCVQDQCESTSCIGVTCGAGGACANGGCLPTSCASGPCAADEVCYQGTCTSAACVGVTCGAGELCAAGSCLPTSCDGVACGAGEVCDQGSCTSAACVGTDCGSGQACVAGSCYSMSCDDVSCAAGEVCVNQACTPDGCVEPGTCPAGTLCTAAGCAPTSCPDGTQCVSGDVCSASGSCVDAACDGVSCPGDSQCVQGACLPTSCGSSYACGSSDVCFEDTCLPACGGAICADGATCTAAGCSSGSAGTEGDTGVVGIERLVALDQVENNGSLSAVNWPSNGHVEVFLRDLSGKGVHVWTNGDTDSWHAPEAFSGTAECGMAGVMSLIGTPHAQVFSAGSGETQQAYFQGSWHGFSKFGNGGTLAQLSTLRWNDDHSGPWMDGRTEVFGLSSAGGIWHRFLDPTTGQWSSWAQIAGAHTPFATGASAILRSDGRAQLFVTDRDGQAWYDTSLLASGGGWDGWVPMGGKLSSRPVVAREPATGVLHVFGRGMNGRLYGTRSTASGFSPFEDINGDFQIQGEPLAAVDEQKLPDGTSDALMEVFVRGLSGRISFAVMNPATRRFASFVHWSDDAMASDPFAWKRLSGQVELLAVDSSHQLVASRHESDAPDGWTPWQPVAAGVDPCPPPEVTPRCPNGNGLYCGGHGIAGTVGTLYSCAAGKLTQDQVCSAGCDDSGAGGADSCSSAPCTSNADCASDAVCWQPALFCGQAQAGTAECTTALQSIYGQSCASDADCNPASGGTAQCVACPLSCPGTSQTCCD